MEVDLLDGILSVISYCYGFWSCFESVSSSTSIGGLTGSSRLRESLSITSTLLTGRTYVIWAKAVEVYNLGRQNFIT